MSNNTNNILIDFEKEISNLKSNDAIENVAINYCTMISSKINHIRDLLKSKKILESKKIELREQEKKLLVSFKYVEGYIDSDVVSIYEHPIIY